MDSKQDAKRCKVVSLRIRNRLGVSNFRLRPALIFICILTIKNAIPSFIFCYDVISMTVGIFHPKKSCSIRCEDGTSFALISYEIQYEVFFNECCSSYSRWAYCHWFSPNACKSKYYNVKNSTLQQESYFLLAGRIFIICIMTSAAWPSGAARGF